MSVWVQVDVCEKKESVWGQGALSEREMDKREGLRRLTEHVYISNGTLLQEVGREGKKCKANKAFKCAPSFSFLSQTARGTLGVPHSVCILLVF